MTHARNSIWKWSATSLVFTVLGVTAVPAPCCARPPGITLNVAASAAGTPIGASEDLAGVAFSPGFEFHAFHSFRAKAYGNFGEWRENGVSIALDLTYATDERTESFAWSTFGRAMVQGAIGNDLGVAEASSAWLVPVGISFSSRWVGFSDVPAATRPALAGLGLGYVGGGSYGGAVDKRDDSAVLPSIFSQGVGVAAWFRHSPAGWELRADLFGGADLVPDDSASGVWSAFVTLNTPQFEFVDAFIEATIVQPIGSDARGGNRFDMPLNIWAQTGLRFWVLSRD